jgi:hypothetical protein
VTLGKIFAECPIKIFDKKTIVDMQFTELSLSSVTLSKYFAEFFSNFTKCFRDSDALLGCAEMITIHNFILKHGKYVNVQRTYVSIRGWTACSCSTQGRSRGVVRWVRSQRVCVVWRS